LLFLLILGGGRGGKLDILRAQPIGRAFGQPLHRALCQLARCLYIAPRCRFLG